MSSSTTWCPTHNDPLFILAMDHRGSFGSTLFDVKDDAPSDEQGAHMRAAKDVIYAGLLAARPDIGVGRAGVLVDERYGNNVIRRAVSDQVVLAVPVEASGHEWFTLEWGSDWLAHLDATGAAYAKVLVRDNPAFAESVRREQLDRLGKVSSALQTAGVPLIFELLVPATDEQLAAAGGDADRYDRDVRPGLVARVIADNQSAGVEPTLWKVEGLDTVAGAQLVADQARAGRCDADLIVLGRDAPAERLHHWLDVAARVDAFVGFAIGRSIWEDVIADWVRHDVDDTVAARRIADTYLAFTNRWVSDTASPS